MVNGLAAKVERFVVNEMKSQPLNADNTLKMREKQRDDLTRLLADLQGLHQLVARFKQFGLKRMFLHASSLSMPHPNGDVLSVSAPLPDELKAVLDALERGR